MKTLNKIRGIKRRLINNRKRGIVFCSPKDELESLWIKNDQKYLKKSSTIMAEESKSAKRNIIIRWDSTHWCNYSCHYCFQNHKRTKWEHCFDVYPVQSWIKSFDNHFHNKYFNLILEITGGEPMLDSRNMNVFLNEICDRRYLLNIRIDTNAFWPSEAYKSIKNKNKVWLNCSYHSPAIDLESFATRIDEYLDDGYNIAMINFVLTNENIEIFERALKVFLKKDIPVNPNPRLDCRYNYNEASLLLLEKYFPKKDTKYKLKNIKTLNNLCLFPAVAYQMSPKGTIKVGCHYWIQNNFIKKKSLLKPFKTYTRCPQRHCHCLDMLSFQKGFGRNYSLNPILSYKTELLILQKISCLERC